MLVHPVTQPIGLRVSIDQVLRNAVRTKFMIGRGLFQRTPFAPIFRLPAAVSNALSWLKCQFPKFDIDVLLPIGLEAMKGAIVCGNPSTPELLVAQFYHVDGLYGFVKVIAFPPYRLTAI